MTRAACLAAALLLAAACGKSSKEPPPPPPPDLTAPRIANPVNREVGRREPLRVRFTEPVVTTAATAVTVRGRSGSAIPATITLGADGTLEVTPAEPLPVPERVEVVVQNVGDAAGNVLLQESALFFVVGWGDEGYASGQTFGPGFASGPEIAREAFTSTHVVWPFGRARQTLGGWVAESSPFVTQALAVDGGMPLRAGAAYGDLSLDLLDPGYATPTPLAPPLPAAGPITASLAACQNGRSHGAVVSWHEAAGTGPAIHTVVRSARWVDGAWTDLGTLGGHLGGYAWNPASACAWEDLAAWVAFEQSGCGAAVICLRVMRQGPADASWVELPTPGPDTLHPALLPNGPEPIVAFTRLGSGADAVVAQYRAATSAWEALGVLDTDPARYADETAMTWDYTLGGLLAAWSEYPPGHPEEARIHVKRWDGAAWTLVGKGPVNDDEPFRPGRRPSIAMGADGVVVVAYLEWDGTGSVVDGGQNHRVRVKRLWR